MIELAVGGGTINMNVGAVGVTGGMTQLSQDFAPIGKAINGGFGLVLDGSQRIAPAQPGPPPLGRVRRAGAEGLLLSSER